MNDTLSNIFKNKILLIVIFILISIAVITFIFIKPTAGKSNIIVENSHLGLFEGMIYPYKALSYPKKSDIKIESLNPDIVTIEKETDLKALKEGKATLLLSNDKESKKVSIEVTKEIVPITKINIKENIINLDYNEEYLLEVITEPLNATAPDIFYESSNTDIVMVNNGYLSAVGIGQCQIEVTANNYKDVVKVIVGDPNQVVAIKKINFTNEVITIGLNDTYQLNPIIHPENASDKKIEYIIENEEIVEISDEGLLKALKKGITKVTASASSGVTAELEIKVNETNSSIALNLEEIQLAKNETYQLKSDYVSGIDWYSSNEKVVTVDNGIIKGVNEGNAVITVINSYGKMNTVNVTVKGIGTSVQKIITNTSEITLKVGKSYQIEAEVLPKNAVNKNIFWETGDSRIVTVTDTGLVFGKSSGQTIITGYTLNNKQVSIKVNVNNLDVTVDSLDITPSRISIRTGDTFQLLSTTIPSNINKKKMTWHSSNDSIATVDNNGLIKGIKTGKAMIYAKIEGVVAQAEVEVTKNIVEISKLNLVDKNVEMNIGENKPLKVDYSPTNATNNSFTWISSNPDIVSVSSKGVLTALNSGSATITVKSANKISDTLKVVVKKAVESSGGDILAVKLNYTTLSLFKGQVKQIRATIIPLNKSQSVIWVSDNPSVAKVNENGTVTALNYGSATISALAKNGMVAKCTIYVTYPEIYLNGNEQVIKKLESDTLKVTVTLNSGVHKVMKIWVADPYKQFHKIDSISTETIADMLNRAIKERDLYNSIIAGSSGSPSHGGTAQGPIIITEGSTVRFLPGSRRGFNMEDYHQDGTPSATQYFGINYDGILKAYGPAPVFNKDEETKLYNQIIADGVKSTIAVWNANILIDNYRITNISMDTECTIRQTFCQIDRNNFIMMTTGGGTTLQHASKLLAEYGCRFGFNMDGGGSSNSLYKNKGDSFMTPLYTTQRKLIEAIYFSEI